MAECPGCDRCADFTPMESELIALAVGILRVRAEHQRLDREFHARMELSEAIKGEIGFRSNLLYQP